MNFLFERVELNDTPLLCAYKKRSDAYFSDYYHWHQCCEILTIHEGSGSVIVDQKTYPIKRGMLFFFQPFQLHKIHADVNPANPYVRTIIHFNPNELEEPLQTFASRHALFLKLWQGQRTASAVDATAVFEYLEQALEFYEQNAEHPTASFEHSLLLILQLLHGLSLAVERKSSGAQHEFLPRILSYSEQIMKWIEVHYMQPIKLEDVADAMHLSKFYVSRLFQHETGSSIPQYITARRIKSACRLLQTTSFSIERIGNEVGIPNASYFIRVFKKEVGTTPLKYRNGDQ